MRVRMYVGVYNVFTVPVGREIAINTVNCHNVCIYGPVYQPCIYFLRRKGIASERKTSVGGFMW